MLYILWLSALLLLFHYHRSYLPPNTIAVLVMPNGHVQIIKKSGFVDRLKILASASCTLFPIHCQKIHTSFDIQLADTRHYTLELLLNLKLNTARIFDVFTNFGSLEQYIEIALPALIQSALSETCPDLSPQIHLPTVREKILPGVRLALENDGLHILALDVLRIS